MYHIVASDLDGTLLNSEHQLSAFTRQVLQALRQRDIHFIFATGRHHIDVEQMRENMDIDAYMITSNGARVHNSKGELILSKNIATDIVPAIVSIAQDNPYVYTHVYCGDNWLINKEDSYSLSFFQESNFTYQLFEPMNCPVNDIAKIYFTTSDDKYNQELIAIQHQLVDLFGDKISIAFSTLNCLEVMAAGVNKGSALAYIVNKLGYKLEQCIAFGDGMNDYEMLTTVGKGCVMKNAPQIVKDHLPNIEVIGANSDDAVPHYLQTLLLK